MRQYVLRRVLASLPIFFIVTLAAFVLMQSTGADAAVAIAGAEATNEQVESIRSELGLDRPVLVQYVDWLGGAATGDLGRSLNLRRDPVTEQILDRMPVTLQLGAIAIVVSLIIAIPVGVLSAVRRNSVWDYAASVVALMGVSIPGFALGFIVLYVFAVKLQILPVGGYVPIWEDPARNLQVMLLPGAVLGMEMAGIVTRLTRSTLLEVLQEDYVRTARAKGLHSSSVLIQHALRNAILPILTVVGLQIGILVGGSFIIEVVFALPGMGRLLVDAINARDLYLIQGVLLVVTFAFVFINLAVDILYGLVDPRIRYA